MSLFQIYSRFVENLENYKKRLNEIEEIQHEKLDQIKERAMRRDRHIAEIQLVEKQNQIEYEKFKSSSSHCH